MASQNASQGLRVLSLDGGGVRGLSELIILEEILKRVGKPPGSDELAKPHQLFDVICGTSTGGLIAIMLGRLRMSVSQCIRQYSDLSKVVFGDPKYRVQKEIFKASVLEKEFQRVVSNWGSMQQPDERMRDNRENACKVFVCAVPSAAIGDRSPRHLRTYGEDNSADVRIWEAARATTAAPTFFKPIRIDTGRGISEEFVDAGLGCQNPSFQLLREVRREFNRQISGIDCFISIGSGAPPRVGLPKPAWWQGALPTHVIPVLRQLANEAESMHQQLDMQFESFPGVYHRFDVQRGLDSILLSDWTLLDLIKTHTLEYLKPFEMERKIDHVAYILRQKINPEQVPRSPPVLHMFSTSVPQPQDSSMMPPPPPPPRLETAQNPTIQPSVNSPVSQNQTRTPTDPSRVQFSRPPTDSSIRRTTSNLPPELESGARQSRQSSSALRSSAVHQQFSPQDIEQMTADLNELEISGPEHLSELEKESNDRYAYSALPAGAEQYTEFETDMNIVDQIRAQEQRAEELRAKSERKRLILETRRNRIIEKQEEFLRSLKVRRPYAVRDRKGERSESTAEWIFRKEEYKQWLSEPAQILLILGPPGQGKSVLAKHILETLQQNNPTSLVLEVFCEDSPAHNTSLSIVRSLLYQVLKTRRKLFKYVGPFLTEPGDPDRMESFSNLWRLFCRILADDECRNAYCIVDGVDECVPESQREFFESVYRDLRTTDKTKTTSKINCRTLLTCRDTVIANEFSNKSLLVRISVDDIRPDIFQYLGQELSKTHTSVRFDDLSLALPAAIGKLSDGMFLWVSLVINELSRLDRQLTQEDIQESLKVLPAPINGLYNRVLMRIPATERVVAHKMLEILIFARYTLDPDEFRIVMNENLANFSSHDVLLANCDSLAAHKARTICGALIKTTNDNEIQLCHHTVKQYLLDPSDKTGDLALFQFDEKRGHLKLAVQCITYLLREDVELPAIGQRGVVAAGRFPFLFYALLSWTFHVRDAGDCLQEIVPLVRKLFQTSGRLRRSLELFSYYTLFSIYRLPVDADLMLHCLVYFGHVFILKNSKIGSSCLKENTDDIVLDISTHIDAPDSAGDTPLFVALDCIDDDIIPALIETLLAHGANPNAKNKDGQKPLHKAAQMEGSGKIIEILLPVTTPIDSLDDKRRTPLFNAAVNGDVETIELLCAKGANVDHLDEDGFTALHFAAAGGKEANARKLLNHNAKQLALNDFQWTPLHEAAREGNLEVCQTLVNHDGDVNARDTWNETPLHRAANTGNLGIVRFFIQQKATLDPVNIHGYSPLHLAAMEGHIGVVSLLIDEGASADLSNPNNGETPLFLASEAGKEAVVEKLLESNPKIDAVTTAPATPLSVAASNGHLEVVKLLLDKGADVQFTSVGKIPMLLAAIHEGHVEVSKLLINKGAPTNYAWNDQFSPIYVAAWRDRIEVVDVLFALALPRFGNQEMDAQIINYFALHGREHAVKRCIEAGVKPSIANANGWTPLHHAAVKGHEGLVKYLLGKGADPKKTTKLGSTPLSIACRNGCFAVAKLLLEAGVKPNLNNSKAIPLLGAAAAGSVDLIRLLKTYGASVSELGSNGESALHCAAYAGSLNVIEELLVWGADAACVTQKGHTVIHYAAEKGNHAVIRRLHKAGAKVDVVADHNATALHSAADTEGVETYKYLLEQGVDPNVQETLSGTVALHSPARFGRLAICKVLLEHGADPNIPTFWQFTAMHYAAYEQWVDIIKAMAAKGGKFDSLDGFGRSAYYWLEQGGCDMAANFPTVERPQEITGAEWERYIKTFVLLLKQQALELDEEHQSAAIPLIGRCFGRLGDFENASIAFERRMFVREGKDTHGAFCDGGCSRFGEDRIEGKRYVCSECPDRDLCEKHYEEYTNGTLVLASCKWHKYFKVPRDIRDRLEADEVYEGKTFREWLEGINFDT